MAHVELTREVARRFNHLYGREPDYEARCAEAVKKMGKKAGKLYLDLRTAYLERGDAGALETARALLDKQKNITIGDRERLFGYLEGGGRQILAEPEALLTPASKMPGLDGQKMSKSYNNTIGMREDADSVTQKLRTMPTDPARVRRNDPGDPARCPVWQLHLVYSDDATRARLEEGCRAGAIGCLDCKQPVIDAVQAELAPIRARAAELLRDLGAVKTTVANGCRRARDIAEETLVEVRRHMGLGYI